MSSSPSWDEWLATKDEATKRQALALLERFHKLGSDDPESWVRSEIDEDIAQLARFLVLRLIWEQELQPLREGKLPYATRLAEAEADLDLVREVCEAVAGGLLFSVLTLIDGDWVDDRLSDPDMPGWRLMEVDRKTGELTGRDVGALHESVDEVDPEGRDGDPFV